MAIPPSLISPRILVDWCRGDWTDKNEDPEGLQLAGDAMHRKVSAVLYFFKKPEEDPPQEVGRWAGPLKFVERPNSRKWNRLAEWFEGTIGPLPGSGLRGDLQVTFAFSGDLATTDLRVAGLSGQGIDGAWSEDANPLVNFAFAGNPTTAWEWKPPPGSAPHEFDYPALTLGLVSGTIENWDYTQDYFRFALSPTWAR